MYTHKHFGSVLASFLGFIMSTKEVGGASTENLGRGLGMVIAACKYLTLLGWISLSSQQTKIYLDIYF